MKSSLGWRSVGILFCLSVIVGRIWCLTTTCSQLTAVVCFEIANAYCDMYAGRCRCKVGYFEDGNRCHSELGSPCSNRGEPCASIMGSLCHPVESVCRCSAGRRQLNLNTCSQLAEEKLQLNPTLSNVTYVKQLNEVIKPSHIEAIKDLDVKSVFTHWLKRMSKIFIQRSAVGSKCSVNTPCLVKYSQCSELGLCECQYGFYHRNGKCSPGLGNACILPGRQCYNIPNSNCAESHICSCKHGYRQVIDHCEPTVSFQSKQKSQRFTITPVNLVLCKTNCPIEHATCVRGSCQCLAGYKVVEDKCISAGVGEFANCTYDWDCEQKNSQCVDKQCQCTPGYILIIDRCLPSNFHASNLAVGSVCSETLPCGVPYSYCGADFRCRCYDGYVADNSECVEIQTQQDEAVMPFV
ncbi:EB module family protein [Trichuris trichiura]|uniref:EB module family protein n=1 Tax=Trichuris trichiura TaxID=36087 RepID=A0A077ZBS3_TRITR|nr:EB module family protein [Trichuris trichiura]